MRLDLASQRDRPGAIDRNIYMVHLADHFDAEIDVVKNQLAGWRSDQSAVAV
jgi:hypothetical protein